MFTTSAARPAWTPATALGALVSLVALMAPPPAAAVALQPQLAARDAFENLVAFVHDLPPQYHLQDDEEFEYIVVGAGAGGCAAAARLAWAGASVLLLEAGGDPDLLSTIPAAAMGLLGSPLDWQYKTVPNNVSCLGSEGRQCRFSRGKCLGGSTSINYMLYTRGNRQDYELDLPGWTWADLEPYFLRYEGLQDLDLLPPSSVDYHNTSGLMKIEFFSDSGNPWHARTVEGLKSLNFPVNPDVNAESQIGVTQVVGYVFQGERMSAARAYLAWRGGAGLRVVRHAYCTGVDIDSQLTARGVTVHMGGRAVRVRAAREVVLSAGAVGSAQTLLLSGVGPAPHLRALGLPVRADLPVGEHMSDHVLSLMFILVDRSLLVEGADAAGSAARYVAARDGPFASDGLTDVVSFANTLCYDADARRLVNNDTECELPTMQLINAYVDRGLISIGEAVIKQSTALNDDIIRQLSEVNAEKAIIIASLIVLNPYSRGHVRLASSDPLAPPEIFPNYLSDDRDVDEILRSITILEHLVETPVYRRHGASLLLPRLEGCASAGAAGSPERRRYWECYVRRLTFSVYHATGTAALGRVLDERLRVRGVRGLRVADLSALPTVPRGNTAAAALAIGERVADFLLEDNI